MPYMHASGMLTPTKHVTYILWYKTLMIIMITVAMVLMMMLIMMTTTTMTMTTTTTTSTNDDDDDDDDVYDDDEDDDDDGDVVLIIILFFRILSRFYVGSMFLISRLHLARSCDSSPTVLYLTIVVPGFTQPSPLLSSSSSRLNHHHYFTHILCSSSHHVYPYHFNISSFMHFLEHFSHLIVVSLIISFLILSSLHGDSLIHICILISTTSNFFSRACFLHCPCLGKVHHCCIVLLSSCHIPLDRQVYSSVTQNPDTLFQFP